MTDNIPEEHVHCIDCGDCLDVPLAIIIDMVLDSREDDNEPQTGFLCEACEAKLLS